MRASLLAMALCLLLQGCAALSAAAAGVNWWGVASWATFRTFRELDRRALESDLTRMEAARDELRAQLDAMYEELGRIGEIPPGVENPGDVTCD